MAHTRSYSINYATHNSLQLFVTFPLHLFHNRSFFSEATDVASKILAEIVWWHSECVDLKKSRTINVYDNVYFSSIALFCFFHAMKNGRKKTKRKEAGMVDKKSPIIISISLALCSIVEANRFQCFSRTEFRLCLLILLLTL